MTGRTGLIAMALVAAISLTACAGQAERYRRNAERGRTDAQIHLGTLYFNGQGVPRDDVQAYMWYDLASATGNDEALRYRAILARRMTPGQIAEARQMAREWKPK